MHKESTTPHPNMKQTIEIIARNMAHHIDTHVDRDEIAKMYLEFSTGEQQPQNWKTTPKQQELLMALNEWLRSTDDITDGDMDTIHVRVGEILSSHPFKNRTSAMSPVSQVSFDDMPPLELIRQTAESLSSASDDEFDDTFQISRGYSCKEHELLHMEQLEGKTRDDVKALILQLGSYLEGEYLSNGNEVSISNGCFEMPVACRHDFLLRVDTNLDGDNRYSVIDVYAREEERRCAEKKYIDSLLNPFMEIPDNAYSFTREGKRILCETPNFFAIVPGNRDSTPQALSETSGPASLIHVLVFTKRRIWNAVDTNEMKLFDFDEAKQCADEGIRIVLENDPTKRIPDACAYDRLLEANEKDMFSTTAAKCYTYEDLAWRANTVEYSFHLYPHNSINTLHMHAWCPLLKTKSYDHQTKDNEFKYVSVESVLKAHKQGKKTWVIGGVYEGDLKDGLPHGNGKITCADGTVYEGECKNGKRHGKGKYTLADGSVYECFYTDDKRLSAYKADVYEGSEQDEEDTLANLTWKQRAGILTDEERLEFLDIGKPPPVGLNFMKTMFYNGERMTVEEFQEKIKKEEQETPPEKFESFDGEVKLPPKSSPIACSKKDLSIPHFPDETRMKLQWFDEGKEHVKQYFNVLFAGSLYQQTYASIPNFVSNPTRIDISWFDYAKEFVKNNWVLVGDETYAQPDSIHTKQGRFQNSIEWNDPLKQSKPMLDMRKSAISVANGLTADVISMLDKCDLKSSVEHELSTKTSRLTRSKSEDVL